MQSHTATEACPVPSELKPGSVAGLNKQTAFSLAFGPHLHVWILCSGSYGDKVTFFVVPAYMTESTLWCENGTSMYKYVVSGIHMDGT